LGKGTQKGGSFPETKAVQMRHIVRVPKGSSKTAKIKVDPRREIVLSSSIL
jgi:hypothetical protein